MAAAWEVMPPGAMASGEKNYKVKTSRGNILDWYDVLARNFDPVLGRWMNVDPMAHEREWLTPYNFVSNNPIMRIDPTGALDGDYYDTDGNYLGNDGIR